MVLKNPLLQPLLILSEREIPVLCRPFHEAVAGVVLVGGVDELVGRECRSAFLTLVAVCPLCSASWTCADDIAVSEELSCHLVTVLLFCYLLQLAVVIELAEEVRGELMVYIGCRAAVYVERYAEVLERFLYQVVVSVHHLLCRDSLFLGTYSDRHSMLVRASYEDNLLSFQTQISDVNISRDVYSGKVSYMHSSIGVWECGGYGSAFILCHYICCETISILSRVQN